MPFRTISVIAPAWSDEPVQMREPTVRGFMLANRSTDNYERSLILLGDMILDKDGKPVGREVVENAPAQAYVQLVAHIPGLMNEQEDGGQIPLDLKSSSSTG